MPIKSTDPEIMKQYLHHALEHEKYVYIWDKALRAANSEIKKTADQIEKTTSQINYNEKNSNSLDARYAEKTAQKERIAVSYDRRNSIFKRISIAMKAAIVVILIVCLIISVFVASKAPDLESSIGVFLACFMFGLFLALVPIIVLIVSSIKSKNAKRAYTRTENIDFSDAKKSEAEMLNSHNNSLNESLKKLQSYDLAIKLDQHEIIKNLNKSKKDLERIYSLNVLPAKYRNFVAVATLYEYLDTGVCTIIEGHGGIYDTYEKDLKLGYIIGSLNNIQNALGRIENNQEILISEYRQANDSLNSIKSSFAAIQESNEAIERNTAISAVANQQTAATARWLAWNTWSNS